MTAESHGHRGNLVIILDVQMPGMTGPELQSRLNTLRARVMGAGAIAFLYYKAFEEDALGVAHQA